MACLLGKSKKRIPLFRVSSMKATMKYYHFFSHPDYTVGTGIPSYQKVTGSAAVKQFADYTAGWDLHPTPKILFLLRVII